MSSRVKAQTKIQKDYQIYLFSLYHETMMKVNTTRTNAPRARPIVKPVSAARDTKYKGGVHILTILVFDYPLLGPDVIILFKKDL